MYALDPIHPVYTAILATVAADPAITVADVHAQLKRRGTAITLQHLYRTVNRLVEAQILLKSGTALTVNLMWLSYLQFFAETAKKTMSEHAEGPLIFPLKEGKHVTLKADTLADLQTLWNHLLVKLHRTEPQKYLLKYYSHAWWLLGAYALEPAFYKRIKEAGVSCYWLFGNASTLDRFAIEGKQDFMDARLAEDTPFPKEGYNLNVYGPYIFECVLPERLSRQFTFIFKTVTDPAQFDSTMLSDIFTQREPLKLKIWRNSARAQELRQSIGKFFC